MDTLRAAFDRSEKALTLRPSLGLGTGVSRTRNRDGLTCEIEDGAWTLGADMPPAAGGDGAAPTLFRSF